MAYKEQWVEWRRASEIFSGDQYSLFGETGISVRDVNQGWIGNCWFMSSASALAEVPGRIERMFLNTDNKVNEHGIYGVNFYTLGIKHTVLVDDYIPTDSDYSYPQTLFAHLGDDNSIWSLILEKAFAKYHGNYEHIVGGWPVVATRTLSGAPFDTMWHTEHTTDEIWDELQRTDHIDDIIQMGTPGSSDQNANEDGLANNHAYTVIGVTTLSNEQRLVKLRNPWGSEDYHGAWSDDSENWTEELKEEVGLEQTKSDGIFFMSIEDYHEQVEETYFNKEVSTWHSAHFLMLDDNTQSNNPGDDTWWCGTDCTKHIVTVKSDANQGVYITTHTWDDRCMAD